MEIFTNSDEISGRVALTQLHFHPLQFSQTLLHSCECEFSIFPSSIFIPSDVHFRVVFSLLCFSDSPPTPSAFLHSLCRDRGGWVVCRLCCLSVNVLNDWEHYGREEERRCRDTIAMRQHFSLKKNFAVLSIRLIPKELQRRHFRFPSEFSPFLDWHKLLLLHKMWEKGRVRSCRRSLTPSDARKSQKLSQHSPTLTLELFSTKSGRASSWQPDSQDRPKEKEENGKTRFLQCEFEIA